MNTFDKVKAIVVEQLGVDEAEVTIDATKKEEPKKDEEKKEEPKKDEPQKDEK